MKGKVLNKPGDVDLSLRSTAAGSSGTAATLLKVPLAALRSVCWRDEDDAESQLHHLEVETKHGRVVVFDHRNGELYADPPRPPGVIDERRWRDLTDEVVIAFDDRPTLSRITRLKKPDAWRFDLSTGVFFVFTLHPDTPVISCNELPRP